MAVQLIALAVLAAMISVAGAMKLLAPAQGATIASDISSRSPARALAVALLPYFELTLAAGLVAPRLRDLSAVACLVLLVAFSLVLLRRRPQADRLPCGCFGSFDRSTSIWWPLARNLGLIVLAIVVVLGDGPSVAPGALGLVVLAAAGVGTSLLLSRELRVALPSTFDGRRPALWLDLELATTDGRTTSVRRWLTTGRPLLLAFVDPLCAPCRSLLPLLGKAQESSRPMSVAIVSRGPIDENVTMAREHHLAPIAVQLDGAFAQALGVSATPAAILLSARGELREGPVLGRAAILSLLETSEQLTAATAPSLGRAS